MPPKGKKAAVTKAPVIKEPEEDPPVGYDPATHTKFLKRIEWFQVAC